MLEESEGGFVCKNHGLFELDNQGRLFLVEKNLLAESITEHQSGINWLKSFLKKFPKFYYFVWHVFCPVMMTVNGPRMIFKYVKKDLIMVDVGSGPERISPEFINVDIFPFSEVDVVADAARLPFRDNSIDAVVSESLIEHVSQASRVTSEIARVLKPGGYVYISAPFITPYHASPGDFGRWTVSGLEGLFPEMEIVKSGVRSGPWSALLMFLAYWLGVIFSFGSKKAAPFMAHIFMIILGPLKYLDYFFMKMPGAEAVAAHLYILGRKK